MLEQQRTTLNFAEIHHGCFGLFANIYLDIVGWHFRRLETRIPFGFFDLKLPAPGLLAQVVHRSIYRNPM